MGNLSGGQVARHNIVKAYGLDEAAKSGIALYSYKELTSAKPASLGEMKRIKEWFRKGMDLAGKHGGDNLKGNSLHLELCQFLLISLNLPFLQCVPAEILEETFRAYEYNTNLFDLLDVLFKGESVTWKTQGFPLYQVIAFIIAGELGSCC